MSVIMRESLTHTTIRYGNKIDYFPHIHSDIEIIYLVSGSGNAYLNGKEYKMEANSIFLCFPNQVHHYSDFSEDANAFVLVFPKNILLENSSYSLGIPQTPICNLNSSEAKEFFKLFDVLVSEYRTHSPSVPALLTAISSKLLPKFTLVKKSAGENCLADILQFCSEHFKEDISVSDIAENLYISKSHVSHTFSKKLGISFCEYINSLRISEAEQLLAKDELSITEIATVSGFSTIRSFNRAFLHQHGISPSQYRKQKRN